MAATTKQTATLGGGCFWCLEAIYQQLRGVEKVESGFAGGIGPADYKEVSSGKTGHAEVVQITFDAAEISFRDLLTVFFAMHDPTTVNRQGADVGTQYRSIVLFHDEAQKADTEFVMAELAREKIYPGPIVTEVAPYRQFHLAESYHQDYYDRNRTQGYCQVVINPKLEKFRQRFVDKLKD